MFLRKWKQKKATYTKYQKEIVEDFGLHIELSRFTKLNTRITD